MKTVTTAEWTAALRSGKYRQGMSALCVDGAFCCLGVLSDIAEVPYVNTSEERFQTGGVTLRAYDFGPCFLGERSFIPRSIASTVISDINFNAKVEREGYVSTDLMSVLMDMNDHGKSFIEIANYIDNFQEATK